MHPGTRQSWRRVLGLASRAGCVTTQRLLDVAAIYASFSGADNTDGSVLAVALALTTVAMALTMTRHGSALRKYKPHGRMVAVTTSILQVAPVYEMIDKVLSAGQPRGFGGVALTGDNSEPLLRSTPPKGSPGENAMRGVRKMSIVNVPQAVLSLWFHIGQLLPCDQLSQALMVPRNPTWLTTAFVAAFFSLSFGIADFVLYVWVDDAFLRENKKLVTTHYCVEILARLPTVVLFHVIHRQLYGYRPTLALFATDVMVTSLLLMIARFAQRSNGCSCLCGLSPRQCLTQCLFSIFVSVHLFFVNIVFFDPGMSFFYVNQVYYVLKYLEFGVMWLMVLLARSNVVLEPVGCLKILELPLAWYGTFFTVNFIFVFLNACFVWGLVPFRRRVKDRRLASADSSQQRGTTGWRARTDPVEVAAADPEAPMSPPCGVNSRSGAGREPTLLDHLGDIMELLKLLSSASRSTTREKFLGLIVDELWMGALPWSGSYECDKEGIVELMVSANQRTVEISARGDRDAVVTYSGSVVDGILVVPSGRQGVRRGHFDGRRIQWDDGGAWTKRQTSKEDVTLREYTSANDTVLRLILPQLALALRWDSISTREARRSGSISPRSHDGGLEAGHGLASASTLFHRPLLRFLIRYAFGTRQADIISDLYWALVCLSHEEGLSSSEDLGYRSARVALLNALRGKISGLDCAVQGEELAGFLQTARNLLRGQTEVWRQTEQLINQHSGRSDGGGAWTHRTEELRSALRRWPELRGKASERRTVGDWMLLQSPRKVDSSPPSPSGRISGLSTTRRLSRQLTRSPSPHIDIVSCTDGPITLPIDPKLQFRGIVIEESEVVASKQAPLILTLRRATNLSEPGDADSGSSTEAAAEAEASPPRAGVGDNPRRAGDEVLQKYLLKVGDDLRQDQLMLQMMELMQCVWLENLAPEDAAQLRLANFKVLAVTPQSGYVKFVSDATPLSEALHIGHGSLTKWLEDNKLEGLSFDQVMDTLSGSVAACCVVTYVLGIGDRHLENLCITKQGQLFHVDFGFVLGDDPKPMAPPVRLPQQVAQALLESNRLGRCFVLARRAYLALRPFVGLWTSILELAAATGDGAGCKKLAHESLAAVSGVRERLRVVEADDERAAAEFLCLMRESSQQLSSILIDKVHSAGLFWR